MIEKILQRCDTDKLFRDMTAFFSEGGDEGLARDIDKYQESVCPHFAIFLRAAVDASNVQAATGVVWIFTYLVQAAVQEEDARVWLERTLRAFGKEYYVREGEILRKNSKSYIETGTLGQHCPRLKAFLQGQGPEYAGTVFGVLATAAFFIRADRSSPQEVLCE